MKIDHGRAIGIVLALVDAGHSGADHDRIRFGKFGPFL
jgi:hypothetical protein